MDDDRLALARGRPPEERDGLLEQPALARSARALPAPRELVRPARRLVGQQPERVLGRSRPPQPTENAGCDPVRLVLVGDLPEHRPGRAALDEQRPLLRVVGKETHRAAAVPVPKRVGLVLALGLGEAHFQGGVRAVGEPDGRDPGDVGGLEGRPDLERPSCCARVDDVREPVEPVGPARMPPPPLEAVREGQTGRPGRTRRAGRSRPASFTLGFSGSSSGGAS